MAARLPAPPSPPASSSDRAPDFAGKLLRYVELRIQYELLQSRARVAPVGAAVLSLGLVFLLGGIALLLLSVGLALALEALLPRGVGFAVVASGYGLGALVLWLRRAALRGALRRRLDALIDHSLADADTRSDDAPTPTSR